MTAASTISPVKPADGQLRQRAAPIAASTQRLVLTGFMGSGKSTVGRLLADQLRWDFADLDSCIEELLHLSVPEIFSQHGEAAFRAAEVDVLRDLLSGSQRVIALGGGAPGSPALRALLAGATGTVVVHLHASFPVLYERCRAQALDPAFTDRPLLGDQVSTAQRYGERLELYRSIAHWAADAEAGAPDVVAASILKQLALQPLTPQP